MLYCLNYNMYLIREERIPRPGYTQAARFHTLPHIKSVSGEKLHLALTSVLLWEMDNVISLRFI